MKNHPKFAKLRLFWIHFTLPGLPLNNEEYRELYHQVAEDYMDLRNEKPERKAAIKKRNPYLNALQIKFAYASDLS